MQRSIVRSCLVLALAACGDNDSSKPLSLADVTVSTLEDTTVAVDVSVTATDVNAVTFSVATPPMHGTVEGAGPSWTYKPAADYSGADSFVVAASDITGTASATVSLTVTAVNDAPVANADALNVAFGGTLTVAQATLLANDTDVDGPTLALTAIGGETHGAVSMSGTDVVFVPEAGYSGAASFMYTISDGMLTGMTTVTVTIGPDVPPVAVDDAATIPEGAAATSIDVLANDTNPDGGPKQVTAVGTAQHGTVAIAGGGASVTYAPAASYCNTIPNAPKDTFTYTLNGGSMATVTVTVTCACNQGKATVFVVGSL